MVWQEEVCNIVCLTNLTEGTKVGVCLRDNEYSVIYIIYTLYYSISETSIIHFVEMKNNDEIL